MSNLYRLYNAAGDDLGELRILARLQPGETIHRGPDQPGLRVTELVDIDDPDSPYTGLLTVEDAD